MTIAQEITFAVLAAVGAAAGSEVIVRLWHVFQVPFYLMQGDGRGSAPLHLSEYEPESAHRCRARDGGGRSDPAVLHYKQVIRTRATSELHAVAALATLATVEPGAATVMA